MQATICCCATRKWPTFCRAKKTQNPTAPIWRTSRIFSDRNLFQNVSKNIRRPKYFLYPFRSFSEESAWQVAGCCCCCLRFGLAAALLPRPAGRHPKPFWFPVASPSPFFFFKFPFPDVVVFSGVWVCCWPVRLAAPQAWHSCLHCAEFF